MVNFELSFFLSVFSIFKVTMSIEGYVSIKIKRWRINVFSPKKAAIVSSSIVLCFLLSDMFLIFNSKFIDYGPGSNKTTICFSDQNNINLYLTVNILLAAKRNFSFKA
jgi:hypothetical protein